MQSKFGGKGARVVADNLRVVRRGFTELTEITEKEVGVTRKQSVKKDAGLPIMLKQIPVGDGKTADIHRFWEQTGNFYLSGRGNDNLVDPFIGASLVPAATGVFRDMTGIRFEHPEWIAENCTACGNDRHTRASRRDIIPEISLFIVPGRIGIQRQKNAQIRRASERRANNARQPNTGNKPQP